MWVDIVTSNLNYWAPRGANYGEDGMWEKTDAFCLGFHVTHILSTSMRNGHSIFIQKAAPWAWAKRSGNIMMDPEFDVLKLTVIQINTDAWTLHHWNETLCKTVSNTIKRWLPWVFGKKKSSISSIITHISRGESYYTHVHYIWMNTVLKFVPHRSLSFIKSLVIPVCGFF